MIAASHTAGLDVQGISAEAALALEAWPSGNRDVIDVMFAPPSVPPATDATRLDSRDRDALIEALGAGSDWLAGIACDLLLHARDPRVAERAARRVQEVAANRRASAVMVAIANDPDPAQAAARFLAASDPPVRVGAAAAIKALAQAGAAGPWNGLLTRALADDDQTVRLAAGADPAEIGQEGYWSCDECGHTNAAIAGKKGISRSTPTAGRRSRAACNRPYGVGFKQPNARCAGRRVPVPRHGQTSEVRPCGGAVVCLAEAAQFGALVYLAGEVRGLHG
jgi:hypothetical protein